MLRIRKHLREMQRYKIKGYNEAFVVVSHSVYGLPESYVAHILHPTPFPPTIPLPLYFNIVVGKAIALGKDGNRDALHYEVEIEFLIDSQDLDEAWCDRYLSEEVKEHVLQRSTREGKRMRMGNIKYIGYITTYIPDEGVRQRVMTTVGREMELGDYLAIAKESQPKAETLELKP
jgi:hypothetical protein